MKKDKLLFKSLAIPVALFLSACGGSANSATLTHNFKSDSDKIFQLSHAISVRKSATLILVTQLNGSVQSFPDSTGSVWASVQSAMYTPSFKAEWAPLDASAQRYINTGFQTEISCSAGQTLMAWALVPSPEYISDGCAFYNYIRSNSN